MLRSQGPEYSRQAFYHCPIPPGFYQSLEKRIILGRRAFVDQLPGCRLG